MKWIGLTGSIGTGKSAVAQAFRRRGVPVIDADELSRQALGPGSLGLGLVVKRFGQDVLNPDQSLNRNILSQKVFGHQEELAALEAIVHPLVQAEVQRLKKLYQSKGNHFAIYDVPLLFEKKISGFDAIIVVHCTEENQIQRLTQRSGYSEAEIRARISHQIPQEEKIRQASFVINNNGSMQELEKQVDDLVERLKI